MQFYNIMLTIKILLNTGQGDDTQRYNLVSDEYCPLKNTTPFIIRSGTPKDENCFNTWKKTYF